MTERSGSVVFAGGGSGGHLFPSLAVATELSRLRPNLKLIFFCGDRPIDVSLARQLPGECRHLSVPSGRDLLQRPWRAIRAYWSAMCHAGQLLNDHPQSLVVSTGGYVSLPVGIAAWRKGRPLVLIEPNAVPGRATSLLAPLAREIYTGWPDTLASAKNAVVTGVPIRNVMAQMGARGCKPSVPTLLILGGSQGASEVNRLMSEIIRERSDLFTGWEIVHQAGVNEAEALRITYGGSPIPIRVESFIENLAEVLPKVSLVVSRSGANTLAELACAGVPAILLPHRAAVRQHQLRNAEQLEREGGARIVHGTSNTDLKESLTGLLAEIAQSAERRSQMGANMRSLARPDAAAVIAQRIVQILDERA